MIGCCHGEHRHQSLDAHRHGQETHQEEESLLVATKRSQRPDRVIKRHRLVGILQWRVTINPFTAMKSLENDPEKDEI